MFNGTNRLMHVIIFAMIFGSVILGVLIH